MAVVGNKEMTEVLVAVTLVFDHGMMAMLLGRCPDIEITEAVVIAAANNSSNEVVEVLLARYPDNVITGGRVVSSRALCVLG